MGVTALIAERLDTAPSAPVHGPFPTGGLIVCGACAHCEACARGGGGWRLALALVAMRSARGVPLATQTPPARAAEVPHEPVEVERVATARALRAERLARGEVAEGGAGAPDSGGPGWTSAPAAASEVRPRRQTRGRGGASGANTSAPASTARRASAGSAARQPRSAPRAGGAQTVCFLVAVQSTRRVL